MAKTGKAGAATQVASPNSKGTPPAPMPKGHGNGEGGMPKMPKGSMGC